MKKRQMTDNEVAKILQKAKKPMPYQGQPYPLNGLQSGRIFEILLYHIFKERIERGEFTGKIDDITLMRGVRERGIDVFLHYQGKNVGLIQCKKHKDLQSKSLVAKEIIKFVLYYLTDRTLITDIHNFTYFYAVSTGFSQNAIFLLKNFNTNILKEPELQAWTENVLQKNRKTLGHLNYAQIQPDFHEVLTAIDVTEVIPEDIDCWITRNQDIARLFFAVKIVINNDFAQQQFEELKSGQQALLETLNQNEGQRVQQAVQDLIKHGQSLFEGIFDTIDQTTHFDRTANITKITELLRQKHIVIVTGEAGIGKSAIVKNFLTTLSHNIPVIIFKADEFNAPHVDDVLSGKCKSPLRFQQLISYFSDCPNKLVVVDALEKLFEHEPTAFNQLLQHISRDPTWELIATCRTKDIEHILYTVFFENSVTPEQYSVPSLTDKELAYVADELPALAPLLKNARLKSLLRVPFYLRQACKIHWGTAQEVQELDEKTFEQAIWRFVIEKNSDRRRQCFIDVAWRRATAMSMFVPCGESDPAVLQELVDDEVLVKKLEPRGFAPAHDLFEDWALVRYIEERFDQFQHSPEHFFTAIGNEPAIRRSFRIWLTKNIDDSEDDSVHFFITDSLRDESVPQYWRDEIITAVLLSQHSENYIRHQQKELLENDAALLRRIIHLLKTACKTPDEYLLQYTDTLVHDKQNILSTIHLAPAGSGWKSIIGLVHQHLDFFTMDHLRMILELLQNWSGRIKHDLPLPDEAREAGLIAFHFLEMLKETRESKLQEEFFKIVLKIPQVVIAEISELTNEVLKALEIIRAMDMFRRTSTPDMLDSIESLIPAEQENNLTRHCETFIRLVLEDSFESDPICQCMPETISQIALRAWLLPHSKTSEPYQRYSTDKELHFDLNSNFGFHHSIASGLRGPFASLLSHHQDIGIDLILKLCNHATEGYVNSTLVKNTYSELEHILPKAVLTEEDKLTQITVPLNDGKTIIQWGSQRLWCLYRATSIGPDVLQSALMALESWLLRQAETQQNISSIFDKLLEESHSVAITAVLVSVAIAYPHLIGERILSFFRVREFFQWDFERWRREEDAKQLENLSSRMGIPTYGLEKIHEMVRKNANDREHRKQHLEILSLKLQGTPLRDSIFHIIDTFKARLPLPEEQTEEEKTWRVVLKRIDWREYHQEIDQKYHKIHFVPTEPEGDIQEFQEQEKLAMEQRARLRNLTIWGKAQFQKKALEQEIYPSWQEALREAQELHTYIREHPDDQSAILHFSGAVYIAAACFRDYLDVLTEEQQEWCVDLIFSAVNESMNRFFDNTTFGQEGSRPAAEVLPLFLNLCEEEEDTSLIRYLIAGSLLHPSFEVRRFAIRGVHLYLWKDHPEFAHVCVNGMFEYAALTITLARSGYGAEEYMHRTAQAIHELRERIAALQISQLPQAEDFSFKIYSTHDLIYALEMIPHSPDGSRYSPIISLVLKELIASMTDSEWDWRNHDFENDFARIFARFVLCQPYAQALKLCVPLVDAINDCPEAVVIILPEFVYGFASASMKTFWAIWDMMSKRAFTDEFLSKSQKQAYDTRYFQEIIRTLLLANIQWKKDAKEWKPLTEHSEFLQRACREVGHYPIVFATVVELFTSIARVFLPDGLLWLYEAFEKADVSACLRTTNVQGNLEHVLRNSIYQFDYKIRSTPQLQRAVMVFLNALVDNGSYVAFQLRERMITPLPPE